VLCAACSLRKAGLNGLLHRRLKRQSDRVGPGLPDTQGAVGLCLPVGFGWLISKVGLALACNDTARSVHHPVQRVPGFDREQTKPGIYWCFMESVRSPKSFSGIFEG